MSLEEVKNSIRYIAECNLNSTKLDVFTISRIILSDKLEVTRYRDFVRYCIVRYKTFKGLLFYVIFFKGRKNIRVTFFGKRKEIMEELYEINSTLTQKSFGDYARACQANDGRDLIEWYLKDSSKEVRLHISQLFKTFINNLVDYTNWKQ